MATSETAPPDVAQPTPAAQTDRRVLTIPLPGVHLPAMPHVTPPRQLADGLRMLAGYVPERERLVYYAGLGALAVAEVVEWPVALAIGVGTEVARRTAPARGGPPSSAPGAPPTAAPETARTRMAPAT
jgi:hypothetical protein